MPLAYERHARRLDALYSPPGTTPILDRLRSFTTVRALVFGSYAEASADVHRLLDIAAEEMAKRQWAFMGARTMDEARNYFISRLRRRLSCRAARAFTRHRLRRMPLVGVLNPSAIPLASRSAAQPLHEPALAAFYAHQAYQVHVAA